MANLRGPTSVPEYVRTLVLIATLGMLGGCAGQTVVIHSDDDADEPRYAHITPGMKPTTIARLGRHAYKRCQYYRKRLDPRPGDKACRWAYLYTSVACDRGQRVSCLLAGRLAKGSYGKSSPVARAHLRTACERGVKTGCDELGRNKRRFAKPPPRRRAIRPRRKPNPGCMDEVACLLSSKPPRCCHRYRKTKVTVRTSPRLRGNTLPKTLSRLQIKLGMMRVRRQVRRCQTTTKLRGRVKLRIRVDMSGRVSNVTVRSTPNATLGKCVATQARKARFRRTRTGAVFIYPFVFR